MTVAAASQGWGQRGAPVAALVFLAVLVACAIFGDWITPYPKDAVSFGATLLPPIGFDGASLAHPLGTDPLGRDVLSRLIAGARISLLTATAAVLVAGSIGVGVGLVFGYLGGLADAIVMRIVDGFLALPFILIALALVAALGSGLTNIILVMIITNWARFARIVRAEVLMIKQRDFVTLARIAGVNPVRIALVHILPNAMSSITALAVLDVGRAIILESSLSFLGLGIQPPLVSWGVMMADGQTYMTIAWWLTVIPGLAIVATVLSVSAVSTWLKGRIDPRSTL